MEQAQKVLKLLITALNLPSGLQSDPSEIEEIEILPNKSIIDKHKTNLNDLFEEIELEMPDNFQILKIGRAHV